MRIEIPEGTIQLVWFVDPDRVDSDWDKMLGSDFYTDLEDALNMGKLLSGDWLVMKMRWQNNAPETNYYWEILPYGSWKKFKQKIK